MIILLWLSGSWKYFLYHSSVYLCHLFLISSASVKFIPFLSCIKPTFAWNVPLVLNFLDEISSLSHSVLSLYSFALRLSYLFLLFFGTVHSDAYIFPLLLGFRFSSFHSYLYCIFSAAKDGEALYSQWKQDQELTAAQIMKSLLPNSDWNWRQWRKLQDHLGMT